MGIDLHLSAADHTREWIKNRKFEPKKLYGENVNLDHVEVCRDKYWIYVACDQANPCEHCGRLAAHLDCIVIAVDGACRGNGTAGAVAATGVFVGNESEYNDSLILRVPRPTNQVAELSAGIRGLEQALAIRNEGIHDWPLGQVVIKADSEYLVKGMTDWVFKWEKNGFRTARGTLVTNAPLFMRLQELVAKLNSLGVEVLFWHVLRSRNEQADFWANMALDNEGDEW
ncbi:ribonuclease H-like domain-containing protein [Xylogone sp. PMI_703]|nr:ribonuclease H-like domain-containing protein [Xylogone sp. PMI_703]